MNLELSDKGRSIKKLVFFCKTFDHIFMNIFKQDLVIQRYSKITPLGAFPSLSSASSLSLLFRLSLQNLILLLNLAYIFSPLHKGDNIA